LIEDVRLMMSRLAALSISLVLLLAAFPLISIGTTTGPPVLWWFGLAALGLGGSIPPVRRFLARRQPPRRPSGVGMPEDDRA
jgi:hypothetical protein